jgi:hypothetical protein
MTLEAEGLGLVPETQGRMEEKGKRMEVVSDGEACQAKAALAFVTFSGTKH